LLLYAASILPKKLSWFNDPAITLYSTPRGLCQDLVGLGSRQSQKLRYDEIKIDSTTRINKNQQGFKASLITTSTDLLAVLSRMTMVLFLCGSNTASWKILKILKVSYSWNQNPESESASERLVLGLINHNQHMSNLPWTSHTRKIASSWLLMTTVILTVSSVPLNHWQDQTPFASPGFTSKLIVKWRGSVKGSTSRGESMAEPS
jgi:hypothetical protein